MPHKESTATKRVRATHEISETSEVSETSETPRTKRPRSAKAHAPSPAEAHAPSPAELAIAAMQQKLAEAERLLSERNAAIDAAQQRISALERATSRPFPAGAHAAAEKPAPASLTVAVESLLADADGQETIVARDAMPELLIAQSTEPIADPVLAALHNDLAADDDTAVRFVLNHTSDDRFLVASAAARAFLAALTDASTKVLQTRMRNLKAALAKKGNCVSCTPAGCPVAAANAAFTATGGKRKRGELVPTCPAFVCAKMEAPVLLPIVSSTSAIPLAAFAIAKFPPLAATCIDACVLAAAIESHTDETPFRNIDTTVASPASYILRELRAIHRAVIRVIPVAADAYGSPTEELDDTPAPAFCYRTIALASDDAEKAVVIPDNAITTPVLRMLESYYVERRANSRRASARSERRASARAEQAQAPAPASAASAPADDDDIEEGESDENVEVEQGDQVEQSEEQSEISTTFD